MNRFQLALHVLQGRPLVYRTTFLGGITISKELEHVIVKDCTFTGGGMEVSGTSELDTWMGKREEDECLPSPRSKGGGPLE